MDTYDDKDTLRQIALGNEEALRRLVQKHGRAVWRTAFNLLGDSAAADDVEQEVFIRVWTKARRFDGRHAPSTWLYSMTCNICYDELRRRRRHRTYLSVLEKEPVVASDVLSAEEAHRMLQRAVDTLPRKQRAVYVLRELEGLSNADTAAALGMSADQTKANYHAARQTVMNKLTDYGIQ